VEKAKKRKYFFGALATVAIIFLIAYGIFGASFDKQSATKRSLSHLVDELSTTPVRQQAAYDQIVSKIAEFHPYMFRYLSDERVLAKRDILTLNTWPGAFEKYHLAEAVHISELIMLRLCDHTLACDASVSVYDVVSKNRQREKLISWCNIHYGHNAEVCILK
jgi:hypothetical protein